ncbi:MAG: C39 family peptidase [Lachnospiraceae bacterium]|nr:C39 family peptidase [Lachnospiraceae bacterium]
MSKILNFTYIISSREKGNEVFKINAKIILVIIILIAVVAGCFFVLGKEEESLEKEEIVNTNIEKSKEIPNLSEVEEQALEYQETENEGFERQGEIAYNGSSKIPNVSVGEYRGLTYYSQVDSRWKNVLYTSTGDYSQTIGSSGCGPTSAAMVVSSIKGDISPVTMSNLYVDYGFRSTNNGTYWSAFKWTADVFDITYQETNNLETAINLVNSNYYVIAGCAEGLFTYGGHFILIVDVNNNNTETKSDDILEIYDPYLYNNKFNVSSRKGKVEVLGNSVFVTFENFKKYANYTRFFCFENVRSDVTQKADNIVIDTDSSKVETNYTAIVVAKSGLNYRTGAGIDYKKLGAYACGTAITIYAESNGWGKTADGWISLSYVQKNEISENANTEVVKHTNYTAKVTPKIGLNYRLGAGINYRKLGAYKYGTIVTIYEESNEWGKTADGWISLDYVQKENNVESNTRKLGGLCTLYSNSNLTGIEYIYKAYTTVTVLEHVSENVDKVEVPKTGRIAYINTNNYI